MGGVCVRRNDTRGWNGLTFIDNETVLRVITREAPKVEIWGDFAGALWRLIDFIDVRLWLGWESSAGNPADAASRGFPIDFAEDHYRYILSVKMHGASLWNLSAVISAYCLYRHSLFRGGRGFFFLHCVDIPSKNSRIIKLSPYKTYRFPSETLLS